MSKPFAFRIRAYSAVHFEWDEVLTVTWPGMEARLQSEYTGGEDNRAYAVAIHGEIRGNADSLEEAEPRFARAIGQTLPMIALAGNASVADPLAIALHGLDLSEPQPFVGYRTPAPNEWFPPGKRRIEVEATHALMVAVGRSEHTDLLQRAIEAYRRALQHWIPESRLLAGEFLFIAAETLSRFMLESRAASHGITPKNLARLEKEPSQDALRRRYLADKIFDADAEALAAVEEASNGFEHGYLGVDEVRSTLDPVLDHSMGLVRRALIHATGVPAKIRSTLLADEYEKPRGLVPVLAMVHGELAREDVAQPPPVMDEGAPVELEWNSPSPVASIDRETGEVKFSIPYEVKVAAKPPNTQVNVDGFVFERRTCARATTRSPDPRAGFGSSRLLATAERLPEPRAGSVESCATTTRDASAPNGYGAELKHNNDQEVMLHEQRSRRDRLGNRPCVETKIRSEPRLDGLRARPSSAVWPAGSTTPPLRRPEGREPASPS